MSTAPATNGSGRDPRLLIIHDLDRLGPVVRDCFAPRPISGVRSYLAGIAEIPRAKTQAVLLGHDRGCRNIEAAVAAIKNAAGPKVPVIFCCEPVYEFVGRKLLEHGADDYVIFPPEPLELERALRVATRATQRHLIESNNTGGPLPSIEELTRLAELLPRLSKPDAKRLSAMAALVAEAVNADWATVSADGKMGRAGRGSARSDAPVLVEMIVEGEQRVGQIRVGPKVGADSYAEDDKQKLRHYGSLLGRLLEGARRADGWRKLALTDDLTGLPNRRHLLAFLKEKLGVARKERMTLSLLVFDIDDFKKYNDQYGHDAGDEILVEVGRLFAGCCRKTDLVSRYGGDEFVVVFWDPEGPRTMGSTPPRGVLQVLQRFRTALQTHKFGRLGPDAVGCLTISGGLVHFPWQATTTTGLLEAADRALLQAKEAGKNRFWLVGRGDVTAMEG
ncbi:MAG TPA: GGDEF domain-containing protein [Phycisphaerae bacterium]|nr:GGDEF domain-containing protein [Phycisphaerae bacterium]